MLRDNLDPDTSVIGVPRKIAAGVVFAETVGNPTLGAQIRGLGTVDADARVEALARAVAPSPARVDLDVVERCRDLARRPSSRWSRSCRSCSCYIASKPCMRRESALTDTRKRSARGPRTRSLRRR
jgi:hypothetical protein